MNDSLLTLLIIYQLKHFLADYPLQRPWMLKKFGEGWVWVKPLAAHSGVHALFTLFIATAFLRITKGYAGYVPLGLALFDFVAHFSMDRIKASPDLLGRFEALSKSEYPTVAAMAIGIMPVPCTLEETTAKQLWAKKRLRSNTYFWWSLGLDQMVHHISHYAIIWRLLQ